MIPETQPQGNPILKICPLTADKPEYPPRSAYFFARFLRWLAGSGLANSIGSDGCWLLSQVVLAEDIHHGPVDFWNDQLMRLCGFGSEDKLDRVRKKVIAAGLLNYRQGGKGRPGIYWVCDQTTPFISTEENPKQQSFEDASVRTYADQSADKSASVRTYADQSADQSADHPSLRTKTPNTVCDEPTKASASSPAVLTFPVVGKQQSKEWHLTEAKVAEYCDSFPGVDVLADCRKALQWCRDNPARRKTPGGMPKFLTGWLTRTQNSGSDAIAKNKPPSAEPTRRDDQVKPLDLFAGKPNGATAI